MTRKEFAALSSLPSFSLLLLLLLMTAALLRCSASGLLAAWGGATL